MLPAERVVRGGEDVSFDVLPLADIAGGQLDGVLHQFSHDGALELTRVVLPLLLLFEFLDDNLVGSVSQAPEPATLSVSDQCCRQASLTSPRPCWSCPGCSPS